MQDLNSPAHRPGTQLRASIWPVYGNHIEEIENIEIQIRILEFSEWIGFFSVSHSAAQRRNLPFDTTANAFPSQLHDNGGHTTWQDSPPPKAVRHH